MAGHQINITAYNFALWGKHHTTHIGCRQYVAVHEPDSGQDTVLCDKRKRATHAYLSTGNVVDLSFEVSDPNVTIVRVLLHYEGTIIIYLCAHIMKQMYIPYRDHLLY